MGRFKIYDPKKLVNVLNDPNYGKCLLCEKTLKTIMGNIKRHYEQMHSVYVNANVNKSRKSKKKCSKFKKDGDRDYKIYMKIKKPNDVQTQNDVPINKIDESGAAATNTTVSSSTSSGSKNILDSSCPIAISKPPSVCRLIGRLSKRKPSQQEIHLSDNNIPLNSMKTSDSKHPQHEIKPENLSKTDIEHKRHTHYSNLEKIKLDEDNEIQIPCHSYINSIQITSLESCRQLDFLKCLVETKSQMNIPLKNFQKGDTFQKALQNWRQTFQFNYSSQIIGEHIDRMAKKLRQEIIKMVANKIVHLKLDIASGKESNVMLLNIQFIKDFEMKIVTLSALELSDDDLVTYLKERVLTTLERYQIDISRVYSITKDNTKNVEPFLKCNEDGIQICLTQTNDRGEDRHIPTNEYCQHLCEQFPGHAIHFVASDIIKQLNENVSQSRDAVKRLRCQLPQLNIKQMPLLDNTTSWFSVYNMIKSLINMREIVESNNLLLEEVDWLFATKFIASFRPIVDIASMLQTNSVFIMGDFYREWLLCELELKELAVSNELAIYMLEAFRKRKKDFFENTSFLAALYMDPRFCSMDSLYLNDEQKEVAITHLLQIFNKLNVTSAKLTAINLNDRYSKLEKYRAAGLKTNMETVANCNTVSLSNVDCQWVKESLKHFQFEESLSFNANILDYWKVAKYKNPILAKIAEVALAAPATQASISRSLNAFSLMKGSKHYDSADVVENLLLLRLNQDLVDKITLEN